MSGAKSGVCWASLPGLIHFKRRHCTAGSADSTSHASRATPIQHGKRLESSTRVCHSSTSEDGWGQLDDNE